MSKLTVVTVVLQGDGSNTIWRLEFKHANFVRKETAQNATITWGLASGALMDLPSMQPQENASTVQLPTVICVNQHYVTNVSLGIDLTLPAHFAMYIVWPRTVSNALRVIAANAELVLVS